MMEVAAAAHLVRFCFGLVLIWVTFYLCVRAYLLDRLRQNLFAIRDDLFDFASDGGIAFDDPAYRDLRNDLNSLIRFAHKMSASRLIFATLGPTSPVADGGQDQWLARIEQLPPLTKKKLLNARMNALREMIVYLVSRSLFLLGVYSGLKTAALLIETARSIDRNLPTFAEPLEAQARSEFNLAT